MLRDYLAARRGDKLRYSRLPDREIPKNAGVIFVR